MKNPYPTPAISVRQKTLSQMLSGSGLASDDSQLLRKICVALAEDAGSGDLDLARAARCHALAVRRMPARALPSQQ